MATICPLASIHKLMQPTFCVVQSTPGELGKVLCGVAVPIIAAVAAATMERIVCLVAKVIARSRKNKGDSQKLQPVVHHSWPMPLLQILSGAKLSQWA